MRCLLLIQLILGMCPFVHAQDTLLLLNGKEVAADSIGFNGHTIYLKYNNVKGLRKVISLVKYTFDKHDGTAFHPTHTHQINPYKAFSIRKAAGDEQIVFVPDPSDPMDFTIDQMRMFIKGEQDADRYYKNNVNKAAAFAVGVGSSLLTIYGVVIPPLYATAIGSFTPRMNVRNGHDSPFRDDPVYCEGYQRKMRDRKIRNALVSGLVGFASGFITLTIIND
jgi:hypothetical protein